MVVLTAILAVAFVAGASAQTIYKCASKEGKTAYSNSPCPGAKVVNPGSAPAAVAVDGINQQQADLVADCDEVLSNRSNTGREAALFNRICPAFGYKAPLGPETDAFNKRYSEQLLRKLREKFQAVPSTTRIYDGGSRMPPLFYGY